MVRKYLNPDVDFEAKKVTKTKRTQRLAVVLNFGGLTPVPDPTPDPQPDPTPDPTPAPPFPAEGLTVMILYETQDTLPADQAAILTHPEVLGWLRTNCAKSQDSWGYRIWDDDLTEQSLGLATPLWRIAYSTAKRDAAGKLPWIVVSDGKRGTSQALPGTVEETLALLGRFKP